MYNQCNELKFSKPWLQHEMVVFSSPSSSSSSSSSSFFVVMSFQGPACPNILQTTPQTLLHQPDDRTGEKLMVEVRAKTRTK